MTSPQSRMCLANRELLEVTGFTANPIRSDRAAIAEGEEGEFGVERSDEKQDSMEFQRGP